MRLVHERGPGLARAVLRRWRTCPFFASIAALFVRARGAAWCVFLRAYVTQSGLARPFLLGVIRGLFTLMPPIPGSLVKWPSVGMDLLVACAGEHPTSKLAAQCPFRPSANSADDGPWYVLLCGSPSFPRLFELSLPLGGQLNFRPVWGHDFLLLCVHMCGCECTCVSVCVSFCLWVAGHFPSPPPLSCFPVQDPWPTRLPWGRICSLRAPVSALPQSLQPSARFVPPQFLLTMVPGASCFAVTCLSRVCSSSPFPWGWPLGFRPVWGHACVPVCVCACVWLCARVFLPPPRALGCACFIGRCMYSAICAGERRCSAGVFLARRPFVDLLLALCLASPSVTTTIGLVCWLFGGLSRRLVMLPGSTGEDRTPSMVVHLVTLGVLCTIVYYSFFVPLKPPALLWFR